MQFKIIKQLFFILIAFLGTWFLLSRIHYISNRQVVELTRAQEAKLGAVMLESLRKTQVFSEDSMLQNAVDSIKNRICIPNGINPNSISVYIVKSDQVNAFALPGRKIIVYSTLIDQTETADELAGVLAHETGHIQKDHVLKKLGKETGLAILFSTINGDAGLGIIRELSKTLTSTAFDRQQETEADMFAVQALANSGIDPVKVADILFRITKKGKSNQATDWLSTHPNRADRVSKILEACRNIKFRPGPPLLKQNWKIIRSHATAFNTSKSYIRIIN